MLDGTANNPIADFHQINTELALFDEKLLERPTQVVINKMDLPEAQAAWDKLAGELRKLGHEPMQLSAAIQMNTEDLVKRVFQMLDELPEEELVIEPEAEEEMPVFELGEDESVFSVEQDEEGIFHVTGARIERAAQMTHWNYDDAIMRFQRILEAMGVSEALEKAGVQPGDTVFIGDIELEWGEDQDI
jgi:GTP-binding protein